MANWPPGDCAFSAVATDNRGRNSTPSVLNANVRLPEIPLVLTIATEADPQTGTTVVKAAFDTVIGKHYEVRCAPEITGPWEDLTADPIVGTGLPVRYTDRDPLSRHRFYRAVRLD